MTAVEDSLRRLKTDWIDLYQLHTPDPLTPIEETLRALDDLVRSGKVRYIGCSNMPAWQVVEALWTSKSRNLNAFVSCQDEYSLLVRHIEKELVPAMQGVRPRPAAVLPAGERTAHRQVQARRRGACGHAVRQGRAARQPLHDRRQFRDRGEARRNSPRRAGTRSWSSRSRGSRRGRRSPASSPARPRPSRSSRTPRRSPGSSARRRWRRSTG